MESTHRRRVASTLLAAALLSTGAAAPPAGSAAGATGAAAATGRSESVASQSQTVAWHLAPSLARLRAEIDSRWPNRSRASDGARCPGARQDGGGSLTAGASAAWPAWERRIQATTVPETRSHPSVIASQPSALGCPIQSSTAAPQTAT